MKRYDSYKDSGVEWIGEVPSHWEIVRMKYLFVRSKAGIWGEEEKGNLHDIVCFRIADFDYQHGCLKFDNLTLRNIEQKQLDDHILYKTDLLIEKSGGGDSTPVGRVVRYNYDSLSVCSNFIHFVSVGNGSYYNYIYYYFNSLYSNKINMLYFNQTTGIQNLKIGEYLSQRIYIPSFYEQRQIASYLDKKCDEVDKVISTQEKRIALLQELKQSIITHTVTKGLNPDVKMKDSGIEWIGKIPVHWVAYKTSLVFNKIGSGTTPKSSEKSYYYDEGYYWLQTGDLNDGEINDTSKKITKKAVVECKMIFYPKGSIVIAMYGATIGKLGLLNINTSTNQACCVLCPSKKINNKFAFYIYKSAKQELLLDAMGGGQPNISQDIIKKLSIPIPPIQEQQEIASYLDKRCAQIDASISKAQKEIELLQEYKQSLITEVVTGKRKVC